MKNYPDVERLKTGAHYYYGSNDKTSNNLTIGFTFTEPIDVKLFRKAAELTLPRYPYFAVKVKLSDEEYTLVRNDNENMPVGSKLPSCWGPETNDYLWYAYVNGCDIEFHCFHGLSDGGGMMIFARSMICRYFILKHPETVDPKLIDLFEDGDECKECEWSELIPDEKFENAGDYVCFDPSKVFCIPMETQSGAMDTCDMLCVKEGDFINYAKSINATPSLAISALMANVAESYRPEGDDRMIVGGITAQIKKFLGVPNSHYSMLPLLNLDFPEGVKDFATGEVISDLRKKKDEMMGDKKLRGYVNNTLLFYEMICQQDSFEKKKQLTQYMVSSNIHATTFIVSYMRLDDFGPLNRYMVRMQNHVDQRPIPWLMEIVAGNNIMTFKSLSNGNSRELFDGFCKELDKVGVKYSITRDASADYVGWNY